MARKREASAREQLGVSLSAALEFSCRRFSLSVSMPRCPLRTISLLFYYLVSSALNLCMHAARLNAMVHGGVSATNAVQATPAGAAPSLSMRQQSATTPKTPAASQDSMHSGNVEVIFPLPLSLPHQRSSPPASPFCLICSCPHLSHTLSIFCLVTNALVFNCVGGR